VHVAVVIGMLVDTDAIRALGTACSSRAADLSAAASALAALPGQDAAEAFGPVGAGFLAALREAAAAHATAITALSADLDAADSVSGRVAEAYTAADRRGSRLL